jgi:hypothetical protein
VPRYVLHMRPHDSLTIPEHGRTYRDGDTIALPPDRMRRLTSRFRRFEPVPDAPTAAPAPEKPPKVEPTTS